MQADSPRKLFPAFHLRHGKLQFVRSPGSLAVLRVVILLCNDFKAHTIALFPSGLFEVVLVEVLAVQQASTMAGLYPTNEEILGHLYFCG